MMASVSRPARMFWITSCWPGRSLRTPKVRSARASAPCLDPFMGRALFRLDVGRPDYARPLVDLALDVLAELCRRAAGRRARQRVQPLANLGHRQALLPGGIERI